MSAEIWSGTDFPHMCLRDTKRTEAFRDAIRSTVRAGDVVLEVGAGSGILSFFAVEAGAERVMAVEIDTLLARSLARSAEANGMADRIDVFNEDAMTARFPRGVDVLISEVIETGLLDEMQMPILNRLHRDGIVDRSTRFVPQSYETSIQLVQASPEYYDFKILAPKHEWPFYEDGTSWHPIDVKPASEVMVLSDDDFSVPAEETIDRTVRFEQVTGPFNAVRLSGLVRLTDAIHLGPTPALNADKIVFLEKDSAAAPVSLQVRCVRGRGLGSLTLQVLF